MAFGSAIVRWYRRAARDLPWRRNRDPYRVWISEAMLQQTQIAAVVPYYRRWMARFPGVRALAAARLDDVLKAWEGLGYYARARHVHRAAAILSRNGFPATRAAWEELPGIGPYTSAAIASIVHGERVAVLDGNVQRVVARYLGVRGLVTTSAVRDRLGGFLAAEISDQPPGDFNQGVMELGQRLCRPRNPNCGGCPVAAGCAARRRGIQDRIPRKPAAKRGPHFEIALGICRKAGRILVARRKAEGLLGGLWEFPGGKRLPGETFEQAVARELREEVGIRVEVGRHLVTVPHRYSHFSVELHAYECRWKSGRARAIANDGVRWVRPGDLDRLAFPTANRRILKVMLGSRKPVQRSCPERS